MIHCTKFDIRQYFLITYTNNVLKVWMYRNCYLRFSSRQFNLDDFSESIHLTNYSIQKNYAKEVREGADALPASNMWSLKRFQEHLQSLDKGFYWERKIYPDMKKNILAIVCASLDGMKMERNMFELYGADFMVTENFRTMLIEINTSPDLSSSTDVTSVICPAVLEDLVKGRRRVCVCGSCAFLVRISNHPFPCPARPCCSCNRQHEGQTSWNGTIRTDSFTRDTACGTVRLRTDRRRTFDAIETSLQKSTVPDQHVHRTNGRLYRHIHTEAKHSSGRNDRSNNSRNRGNNIDRSKWWECEAFPLRRQ